MLSIDNNDFEEELKLLSSIRKRYDAKSIELRLDANGAFCEANVHEKLEQLATFDIHSIEQPIQTGQTALLQSLCKKPIIPIALDEELIHSYDLKSCWGLTAGNGNLALTCLCQRRAFFGVCLSQAHKDSLLAWLEQRVWARI